MQTEDPVWLHGMHIQAAGLCLSHVFLRLNVWFLLHMAQSLMWHGLHCEFLKPLLSCILLIQETYLPTPPCCVVLQTRHFIPECLFWNWIDLPTCPRCNIWTSYQHRLRFISGNEITALTVVNLFSSTAPSIILYLTSSCFYSCWGLRPNCRTTPQVKSFLLIFIHQGLSEFCGFLWHGSLMTPLTKLH